MKTIKTTLALLVGAVVLSGCNESDKQTMAEPTQVKIATYNLSFDRATFADLVAEMQIAPETQQRLVTTYLDGTIDDADKSQAEKVIQIRNVAAIIQKNRPDVLMMAEYNNDGTGENKAALIGFQTNYLSVAQSLNGAGGGANLEPIEYLFRSLTRPIPACFQILILITMASLASYRATLGALGFITDNTRLH